MRGESPPPSLLADLDGVKVRSLRQGDPRRVVDEGVDAPLDGDAQSRFDRLRTARLRIVSGTPSSRAMPANSGAAARRLPCFK